jgi:hypothetical protein
MAAFMRQARHDQQLRRYHDRNVKETSFNVGDLVLRRIQKTDSMHKLSAPWFHCHQSHQPIHVSPPVVMGKAYCNNPPPRGWARLSLEAL